MLKEAVLWHSLAPRNQLTAGCTKWFTLSFAKSSQCCFQWFAVR